MVFLLLVLLVLVAVALARLVLQSVLLVSV
jgi:hypothetical protein